MFFVKDYKAQTLLLINQTVEYLEKLHIFVKSESFLHNFIVTFIFYKSNKSVDAENKKPASDLIL